MDELRKYHLKPPCYFCGAKSGERCTSPKGKKLYKPHADRIMAGTDMWVRGA